MKIDVSNYDKSRVARVVLSSLLKMGAYSHMEAYQSDMFIDYDILSALNNITGIYIIRDSGTQLTTCFHCKDNTENTSFEYDSGVVWKVFGTDKQRAFVIRDRQKSAHDREIEITEFNPSDPHHRRVALDVCRDTANGTEDTSNPMNESLLYAGVYHP